MKITIPISVGELLDKISILQIKFQKTSSEYVEKELNELINIAIANNVYEISLIYKLKNVNKNLWEVENEVRRFESSQNFCARFIELARSVYKLNDERSKIKKEINNSYNSEFREIKIYQ
jgi:hypothetical protein